MASPILRKLSLLSLLFINATPASAWGERGHDAVTRVAARLLAADEDTAVAAWGKLLTSKENMLAHLANVPDIVWRQQGKAIDPFNVPSHFIDLEYILPNGLLLETTEFPLTIADFKKRLEANCQNKGPHCAPGSSLSDKLEKAGHAPFRIQFLMQDLSQNLKELKKLEGAKPQSAEAKTEVLSRALLYTGVLSHFVGDLSNPHHTTSDYDGWQSDQGGLHSYFESDMVDVQDLGLEQEVFNEARRHKPAEAMMLAAKSEPLLMAWQLVRDSHQRKQMMAELDQRYSLLKKSSGKKSDEAGKKQKAQRKDPKEVASHYRDALVLRLAIGADALARFWKVAYIQGQRPDISFYRSYNYPVEPAFIPLGYEVRPESELPK